MAAIKHTLVSAVVDDGVVGEIGPSEWNDDHVVQNGSIPIAGLAGTPAGELGGTWASPTVNATHSGSAHLALATNAIVLGTAAAAGAAGTTLRSNDTIAAFDGTVPVTQASADAAATGSAAFAARRDHKHGMPTIPAAAAGGTPAVVLGTAAVAGSSVTFVRDDDTIIAFDASVPVTQAFGDAAATGSVALAARRDHKHGMPSERAASSTTPATVGTAAVGTGTTDARSDHVHATGAGTPTNSALADAAATGSGPAAAMTDHKHGRESFATNAIVLGSSAAAGVATTPFRSDDTIAAFDATVPTTSAVGDAAAAGSVAKAARRDHVHGREAFVTPAIVLGTAAAAGAATTPIRSDATIVAFDATVPTTAQPNDAAAAGSAAVAARRDHGHARESFAQTLYDPSIDQTLVANATAYLNTDPIIADSGRLISVPAGAVMWADAPRTGPFDTLLQSGGTTKFGSTATFYRQDNSNAQIAAMYVNAVQNGGGGTGVLPIVGIVGSSSVTGGAFASPSHSIGVLGIQTLTTGNLAGAGTYGMEGRVDHSLDTTGNPTGWGLLGLGVANTNNPANAYQVLYGVEGRVEYGPGVTGTNKQFFIAGKFSVSLGSGVAIGSPLAYNLIVGDGSQLGNNFPISLRGYVSKTASLGEAACDFTIVDAGAAGGYLYINATDAKLSFGVFMKLMDNNTSAFSVVNNGGRTVFNASAIGLVTIGSATINETAAIDLLAANATPSAPASGISRYYRDPNDGLLKSQDSLGNVSIMENFAPAKLSQDSDEFMSGAVGAGPGIGTLAWTSFQGLAGGVTAVAGLQNHPGIINKSTLATSDAGVLCGIYARGTPATGTVLLDIANTVTDIIWIVRLNTINTNTNVNYRIGLMTDPTAAPTDGVYVEKLAADVGLFGVCRAGGVQTRTTALVVAAASATTWSAATWMKVRIRRVNSTTIGFSVNGFAEQTIATNVPTLSLSYAVQLGNNSTANAFTVDIDYFQYSQSGFSR